MSFAAGALGVLLATIAVGGALRAGLAPWPGIAVITMAAAAFVVGSRCRLRGCWLQPGVVSVVYGLVQTDLLAAAAFPGPVFGIIIGLPVLGLGVAKAVATAQVRVVDGPRR